MVQDIAKSVRNRLLEQTRKAHGNYQQKPFLTFTKNFISVAFNIIAFQFLLIEKVLSSDSYFSHAPHLKTNHQKKYFLANKTPLQESYQ